MAACLVMVLSPLAASAALKTPEDKFVRTANNYYRSGTDITSSTYPELAKFDLVVLPAEAQNFNRPMFAELRRLNPNIVLLAYVPSKSFNFTYWTDTLHQKLKSGIQDDWWLKASNGTNVSVWPGTAVISSASGWNSYLPQYVHDEIWSTGLWDGVFYDEFSATISWANGGDIDLHRDGIKDDPALMDTAWKRGSQNILSKTRSLLGSDAVIMTNGDSDGDLQQWVNGRYFESFPTPWEAGGTWSGVMANYLKLHDQVGYPAAFIVNSNTKDTGNNADYRKVRFGLCSTLMGDGYFSFDYGESSHAQLWRYDEYDAKLGKPLGAGRNILPDDSKNSWLGVWRRDFENGVALVNPSAKSLTVNLDQELEKLRGSQDPQTNDGSIVTSVTLEPQDGVILLKRLDKLVGPSFPNGAFVRLYNAKGERARAGFFSYVAPFGGGATVNQSDLDGDGSTEKVVTSSGSVEIRSANNAVKSSFKPFGDSYTGDSSLAVADINGDGKKEIIVGAAAGSEPRVRVYDSSGSPLGASWLAYDSRFRGGVNVAVGDIYGTGRPVVVVGAGPGGGPHVRIFSYWGRLLHPGFFAYDYRFRGGVRVAAGDVNGDGREEIVTGAGPGGGPHVRIFNRNGRALSPGFFVGDPSSRNGINVAVSDINGDGVAEIAAFTVDVFQFSAVFSPTGDTTP
jgi:hypothetical protein